jgi:chorismate mutase
MQALADALKGVDVPVFVKNPVNPDLELWIGALLRLNGAGVKKLGAIHRGFSSYDKTIYRNLPMWQIPIELRRRIPELPIICDPSHIGCRRDLIAPLCQQAMDLGADGLIVESHCDPDSAWSDAKQQVTPDVLDYILSLLVIRDETTTTEGISQLRKQIDQIDNAIMDILSKNPNFAPAYSNLGNLYWELGDIEDAWDIWSMGSIQFPQNSHLKRWTKIAEDSLKSSALEKDGLKP